MFAWVLIASFWVAVLSLILHDVTKGDSDGSAISIIIRNFIAFTFRPMLKVRKLWETYSYRTSQRGASKPPLKPARAPRLKRSWWRKDHRVSIATRELELAISEAVKKAAPGCDEFVGVMVQHDRPKSHLDPNWAIRGVKFGKADRKVADEALATVVERMQREFLLSDD